MTVSPVFVKSCYSFAVLFALAACDTRESTVHGDTSSAAAVSTSLNAITENGSFTLTLQPLQDASNTPAARIPVGKMHRWRLALVDSQGAAAYPARIIVGGGMPAHQHGLPTQPQVVEHLGDGRYIIDGVRFNMDGDWVFRITIATEHAADRVEVPFNVQF